MFRALLIYLGIPVGVALAIIGGLAAFNAASLQSQGRVVNAKITQSQTDDNDAYEIKYEFRVAGGATTYTHSDETGRRNLWVTLANNAGGTTTPVRYLPSNPWVNAPMNTTADPMQGAFAGLGVGVLLAVVGVSLLVSDINRRRHSRAPAAIASQ